MSEPVKINVGCGLDYRPGFVNVDGNPDLPRVDKVIDFDRELLSSHFAPGSADLVLANDFIEHHLHWHAVKLLKDFFRVLKPGGGLSMQLPDIETIMAATSIPVETRIFLLYGGQDFYLGEGNPEHRKRFPHYHCHKFGYTRETMRRELEAVGFVDVESWGKKTDFVIFAKKP